MPLKWGAGEDSWESLGQQGDQTSQSWGKSTLNTHWKDWCWSQSSSILVTWCELIGKVPNAEKDWWQTEKRASEDETAGWHHLCNGHELGQTLGDGEGHGGLVCCCPWACKVSDVTGWLNNKLWKKIKEKNDTRLSQLHSLNDHCFFQVSLHFLTVSLSTFWCPPSFHF